MPSRKRTVVDSSSRGASPKKIRSATETVTTTIPNFQVIINYPGTLLEESPRVEACGRKWYVNFFPHWYGQDIYSQDIYFRLYAIGNKHLPNFLRARIRIKGLVSEFQRVGIDPSGGYVLNTFFKPNDVVSHLEEDGSLVIEIDIKKIDHVWYPSKVKKKDMLVELYQDASSETSDAIFSVGEATYRAHKCIHALNCKKLHELSSEWSNDTPIPIPRVKGQIFKAVLDFVYGVNTEPKIESADVAKELLVAADCFECVGLKLYAESLLADVFLCVGNAVALLTFADSHSCALLKEEAANLIVENVEDARKSKNWSEIQESKHLLSELFDSLSCRIEYNRIDVDHMSVNVLREEIEKANLDLDGSREVLVERLKAHKEDGSSGAAKKKRRTI
jgi:hypothetical protein